MYAVAAGSTVRDVALVAQGTEHRSPKAGVAGSNPAWGATHDCGVAREEGTTMSLRRTSAAISPTAHYTGYVWARHGIGPAGLATRTGAVLYNGLRPAMAASAATGGPTLEGLLLGRHRAMDALLTEAIESGRIGQVVEIAAGLSPRGHQYATTYGEKLTYVEADLPGMAALKRQALARVGGPGSATHRVVDFDALATAGPHALSSIMAQLDPTVGTAVITEGLLNYLPTEAVTGLWARLATELRRFPAGLYLSDLHLAGENRSAALTTFSTLLGAFVRGRIHFHFADVASAEKALRDAGFREATLHRPDAERWDLPPHLRAGARLVRVVEAQI